MAQPDRRKEGNMLRIPYHRKEAAIAQFLLEM